MRNIFRRDARGRTTPGVTHEGAFVAGRDITLEGVLYRRFEDQIPGDVVARCKNASALLSRRWIIPITEVHVRRLGEHPRPHLRPTPDTLHHTERRALLESRD